MPLIKKRLHRKAVFIGICYAIVLALGTTVLLVSENSETIGVIQLRTHDQKMEFFNRTVEILRGYNITKEKLLHIGDLKAKQYKIRTTGISQSENLLHNFVKTMIYSLTMISTIGYGIMSPKTGFGKIFSVFFFFLGIPVHVTFMKVIGGKYLDAINSISEKIRAIYPNWNMARPFTVTVCALGLVALLVVCPALAVNYVDEWNFIDSLYYAVLTISTVGCGKQGKQLSGAQIEDTPYFVPFQFISLIWLVFGIAFAHMCFVLIAEVLEKIVHRYIGFGLDARKKIEGEEDAQTDSVIRTRIYNELMNLTEEDNISEAHIDQIDWLIGEIEQRSREELEQLVRIRSSKLSKT